MMGMHGPAVAVVPTVPPSLLWSKKDTFCPEDRLFETSRHFCHRYTEDNFTSQSKALMHDFTFSASVMTKNKKVKESSLGKLCTA